MLALIFLAFQQRVNYKIDVFLDTEKHVLYGKERITYINNSPNTLKEMYFHLYPNAYRKGSVRFKEAGRFIEIDHMYPEGYRDAGFEVKKLEINGKRESFSIDGTIMHVSLDKPIGPKDTASFYIEFEEYIPALFARWGRFKTNYHISQWYPKPCVYDEKGWHPDEFHYYGEFYGEFGDFDVSITVPAEYKIAASGVCVDKKEEKGKRTERFIIKNAHDFAFCVDKRYRVKSEEVRGVRINLYYFCSEKTAERALEYAKKGLLYYWDKYGPYPYKEMDVVETEEGVAGMEYPGLVMIGKTAFELPVLLDFWLEDVIVHEIGHNWWYGAIANNETDEAWLDEGINTFSDRRYIEDAYGKRRNVLRYPRFLKWLPNITLRDIWEESMIDMEKRGYGEEILKPSHDFREPSSYTEAVYTKASLVMDLLKDSLGEELFNRVMREYYRRYRFRHVSTEDFVSIVNEVTGKDFTPFFDYWLKSKYTDYRRLVGLSGTKRKGIRVVPLFDFPQGDEVLVMLYPLFSIDTSKFHVGAGMYVMKRFFTGPRINAGFMYETAKHQGRYYIQGIFPFYLFKRPVRYQAFEFMLSEDEEKVALNTIFSPFYSGVWRLEVYLSYIHEDTLNISQISLDFSDTKTPYPLTGTEIGVGLHLSSFYRWLLKIKRHQRVFWETKIVAGVEYGEGERLFGDYFFHYSDIPGFSEDTTGYSKRELLYTGIEFPLWQCADKYILKEYLKLRRIRAKVYAHIFNPEEVKRSLSAWIDVEFHVWNLLGIRVSPGYVFWGDGKKGFLFDFRIGGAF